jgi:hypothetical protein
VAVTHNWYAQSGEGLLAALWTANAMKVMLLKPTYTPDRDNHKVYTDISAQEVANGGGYTTGGLALTTRTAVYNASTDSTDLKADDSVWGPGATFDAAYAAIYDNGGTKPLWSLVDFGGTKSVAAGTFTIDWLTAGLLQLIAV